MSLILGNTIISGVTTPLDGSIAIGQIISSIIPLTDAGLHLLDGSLIQGGGIYNNFVQYIANLFNLYPQCFTDETTWQNTVNSKGVCGKFVYDSVNNTVRLPKITGFIEGTVDSNALGDLVEAGLPNITGGFTLDTSGGFKVLRQDEVYGAFNLDDVSNSEAYLNASLTGSVNVSRSRRVKIDASRSSSIYGNSNTVQPQSIKVFYYIVVATTTKTDIEVDIDEIVTDLNSKANNADVVHKTGNETIIGHKIFTNGMTTNDILPKGDITLGTSTNTWGKQLQFQDTTGKRIARIQPMAVTTTNNRVGMWVNNADNTVEKGIYIDSDGTTSAPTPATSDNSTKIATTAWVNTKFQVVSTLPANPNSNIYYFIPE